MLTIHKDTETAHIRMKNQQREETQIHISIRRNTIKLELLNKLLNLNRTVNSSVTWSALHEQTQKQIYGIEMLTGVLEVLIW